METPSPPDQIWPPPIPVEQISNVQQSVWTDRTLVRVIKFAVVGALYGGILGVIYAPVALYAMFMWTTSHGTQFRLPPILWGFEAMGIGSLLGSSGGLLAGLLTGVFINRDSRFIFLGAMVGEATPWLLTAICLYHTNCLTALEQFGATTILAVLIALVWYVDNLRDKPRFKVTKWLCPRR